MLANDIGVKCPVCNSTYCSVFLRLYDDRYGYPGNFQLFSCSACGHKFLQDEFSEELLTTLYSKYYPRSSFKIEEYKPHEELRGSFEAWLNGEKRFAFRWVSPGVTVLDIGCGFCETLGYHQVRGCKVYGVEADENARRVADKFGFNVHVGLFNPDIYENNYFDIVTMDQVIEHVKDPVETLRGVARILKPGGQVILSTPNPNGWGSKVFGRRWINWHIPYHIQHFSIQSMKLSASEAGLEFVEAKTITSSDWLNFQWIHLLTYPKMGQSSSFWLPNQKFTFRQKLWLRAFYYFHRLKINHLITRFFDVLGIGDNYVFFLRKK